MKTFKDLLIEFNACNEARIWTKDKTIEEVVETCHRGDWLLWLGKKLYLPLNKMTLAKARCAKTVIHLMKDQRSVDAVNIAEKFGLDECTRQELIVAAEIAADVTYVLDAYVPAAAAAAGASAVYGIYADADVATATADASAIYGIYADGVDSAAKIKNQQETANICKEIIGQLIIDKVNSLINS